MNFDMNKMLQEAQRMQAELRRRRRRRQRDRGGLGRRRDGHREATERAGGLVAIDPRAIDPDDPELLADLVLAAVNEALRSARGLMGRMSGSCPAASARSRRVAARLVATPANEACPKGQLGSRRAERPSRTSSLAHGSRHREADGSAAGVSHPLPQPAVPRGSRARSRT
jgi:DNA-binding protein YbaB